MDQSMNKLRFNENTEAFLTELEKDKSQTKILKAVRKTLGLMETNLKHPSLNTHEFKGLKGPLGEKVFEAYAQQNTPGAYRVLWYYGPGKNILSIAAIIPHP